MQRFQATGDDVLTQGFDHRYAEAKRLVLEHNDMDGAIACLSMSEPQSQSHWWQWTDFLGALLFRKGEYSECLRILASYDARYPGDPRIASLIQKVGDVSHA